MNRLFSVLFFLALTPVVFAQVGINDDQSDPAASAMLDVKATDKGVLIPRMTTVQRDAIASPATGLLVYVSDEGVFNYFDGVTWRIVGDGAVDLTDYLNGSNLENILSVAGTRDSAALADASNEVGGESFDLTTGAGRQTFTAVQSGELQVVDLHIYTGAEPTSFSLAIYAGDYATATLPGTSLVSQAFTVNEPGWVQIVLDSSPELVAGEVYTIVLSLDDTAVIAEWTQAQSKDPYAGGRASTGAGDDFLFRTSVKPSGDVSLLALDQTSGQVSLANGAVAVVGQGEGRLYFDASKGAFYSGTTDVSGYEPTAGGLYSTAFGHNALASGTNAFAVGDLLVASGDYSMALGIQSTASGRLSMAMGDNATATAPSSVSIGDQTTASARAAIAIGKRVTASGPGSIGVGEDVTSSGDGSLAIGRVVTSTAEGSVAFGSNAQAGDLIFNGITLPGMAKGAVAWGSNVTSNGAGAFAIGQDTTAIGTLSYAFGNRALTEGENALAVGNRAEAYGARSVALGDRVKAYGDASVALGLRNNAQSFAEFVVGSYTPDYVPQSTTAWNAADRLFVVGNGPDSSNRSTALIVYKNGDSTLNGQLTLSNGSAPITFPNADGTLGQVLATDGNGTLGWVTDGDSSSTNELQTLSLSGTDLTLSNGGSTVSIADGDSDATNELQNLSSSASGTDRTINISDGTGTTIDVADDDNSSTNELQDLSSSASGTNRTINISGGTGTTIDVADDDTSTTNELQTLTLAGSTLALSDGGSVDLSLFHSGSELTNITSIFAPAPTDASSAVVDQVNIEAPIAPLSPSTLRQTFTAGVDGLIHSVVVSLVVSPGAVTTVQLYRGDHGDLADDLSGATLLGTSTLTATELGGFLFEFVFADEIHLTVGEVCTLQTLKEDSTKYYYSGANPYPNGSLNNNPANDMWFQTKMRASRLLLEGNADGTLTLGSAGNSIKSLGQLQTGSLRLRDGNQGTGRILVSDADGVMTWTDPTTVTKWTVSGTSISSTNTGNVGIGTTSPDTKLSVVGYVRAAYEAAETNFTEIGHGGTNGFIRKWGAGNLDFRTQTGTWMSLTDDGELGIGTDDPTALLDVNGTVRIRSGTPIAGKVLTTTGPTGDAVWKTPGLNSSSTFKTTNPTVTGSTTGWQNVISNSISLTDLEVGDRIMLMVSCRVKVGGTAGTDDYTFRVGQSGTVTFGSNNDTGLIEHLDQHRGQWQDFSFHRTTTVTTVSSGTLGIGIFGLQVEMSNADDTIEFDDIELTVFKL